MGEKKLSECNQSGLALCGLLLCQYLRICWNKREDDKDMNSIWRVSSGLASERVWLSLLIIFEYKYKTRGDIQIKTKEHCVSAPKLSKIALWKLGYVFFFLLKKSSANTNICLYCIRHCHRAKLQLFTKMVRLANRKHYFLECFDTDLCLEMAFKGAWLSSTNARIGVLSTPTMCSFGNKHKLTIVLKAAKPPQFTNHRHSRGCLDEAKRWLLCPFEQLARLFTSRLNISVWALTLWPQRLDSALSPSADVRPPLYLHWITTTVRRKL